MTLMLLVSYFPYLLLSNFTSLLKNTIIYFPIFFYAMKSINLLKLKLIIYHDHLILLTEKYYY